MDGAPKTGSGIASGDSRSESGIGERTPAPRFRRARPADALDLATETFLDCARVDMQTLAAQLDVSPATLYRWFGSRAALLDGVVERLTERFSAGARTGAHGAGDQRVCDYARLLMQAAAPFEPARSFVAREPALALRLILAREGAVHRVLVREMNEVIAEVGSPAPPAEQVHLIVQVATALVWATFMVGDEPQIDSAVEIIAMMLAANASAS